MGSLLYTSDGSLWWRKWLGSPTLSITKLIVTSGVLSSFWLRKLKQGIFLASWLRPTASGKTCFLKETFFTAEDAMVSISSTKAADLNRQMRSSNLQQNTTKTGNSRISLKLPKAVISGRRNPFPKERVRARRCCFTTANRAGGWRWGNIRRQKRTEEWLSVYQRLDAATTKRGGTGAKNGGAQRNNCWPSKEGNS